jgi:hypothetical protein
VTAVLPHYKPGGPASYQAATLIYGGQLVMPNTLTAGTTDLTVKIATSASVNVLGVAGTDANVVTTQTGTANSYGQPLIDISVLTDYVSVYSGGVDIWCWYVGAAILGQRLIIGATGGAVTGAGAGPAADQVVGICSMPGGVSSAMLTQQIGGQGSAVYFLGRARVF